MRLSSRLRRLEEAGGGRDDGGPACRGRRGRIVMVTSQRLPDGTRAPDGDWPAPCAACGVLPEQTVEIVKPIMGGHVEAADRPCRAPHE